MAALLIERGANVNAANNVQYELLFVNLCSST